MHNLRNQINYFDFVGKTFNKFTVLKAYRHEYIKRMFFELRCECGTITNKMAKEVYSGHTKSCGCLKLDRDIVKKDYSYLVGKKYGQLTITGYFRKKRKKTTNRNKKGFGFSDDIFLTFLCDCGKESFGELQSIQIGRITSCGCKKESIKENFWKETYKTEVGNVYGFVTVIKEAGSIKNAKQFLCRCECGNEFLTTGVYLRQNKIVSCGCYKEKIFGNRLKIGEKWDKIVKNIVINNFMNSKLDPETRLPNKKVPDFTIKKEEKFIIGDAKLSNTRDGIEEAIRKYSNYCDELWIWCFYNFQFQSKKYNEKVQLFYPNDIMNFIGENNNKIKFQSDCYELSQNDSINYDISKYYFFNKI